MPRFVILEHDHPMLHWDFMLEIGKALRTWRLASLPRAEAIIAATSLGDHRLAYLDFEGPVSGGRGTVTQWDRGEFEELEHSELRIVVKLQGKRLRGNVVLEQGQQNWLWQLSAN